MILSHSHDGLKPWLRLKHRLQISQEILSNLDIFTPIPNCREWFCGSQKQKVLKMT